MSDTVICFDLDDTLYKEIDFVKSAYEEIAEREGHSEAVQQMIEWYYEKKNVFEELIAKYELRCTKEELLTIYRNHLPKISLEPEVKEFLDELKDSGAKVGLITDGRSLSQRNKVSALGLKGFFDIEVISEEVGSEKPNLRNYQIVMDNFPDRKVFVYVGDNPKKDFLAPNQLCWRTYCLKNDGRNIHKQDFSLDKEFLPQYVVSKIIDVIRK